MHRLLRPLLYYGYKPLLERYLNRNLTWQFRGLQLHIKKGVFHPAFFGSTKVFAAFLASQELAGKSLLEVGCGSGLLSLLAAKQGATVLALDINPNAVETTRLNAKTNQLDIKTMTSDIFDMLPPQPFDIIISNPPYFPAQPQNDAAYAWYCGPDFDFFHRFFSGLQDYIQLNSRVWMILSEVCDLVRIGAVAESYGYELKKIHSAVKLFETFVVLEARRSS